MASQPRTAEQAESRRHDVLTVVIASAASAVAAVVVSQFWFAGTWIAAALTPVLVAVIREALERPTTKIADRVTTDRTAVQPRVVMPPDDEPRVEAGEPAPMRVYTSSSQGPSRKRKIALRAGIVLGILGFVIAFSAITITDLVTGSSIGGGGKRLTFGGGKKSDRESQPAGEDEERRRQEEERQPAQPEQTQPDAQQPTTTQPQPTTPTQPTAPQQTAPRTTPAPQQPPGG